MYLIIIHKRKHVQSQESHEQNKKKPSWWKNINTHTHTHTHAHTHTHMHQIIRDTGGTKFAVSLNLYIENPHLINERKLPHAGTFI